MEPLVCTRFDDVVTCYTVVATRVCRCYFCKYLLLFTQSTGQERADNVVYNLQQVHKISGSIITAEQIKAAVTGA